MHINNHSKSIYPLATVLILYPLFTNSILNIYYINKFSQINRLRSRYSRIELLTYINAGAEIMRIATMLDRFIGYFSDAASRIFGLDRNKYPATGVQPFEGEIEKKHHR
jgi:hypothetical protein